MLRHKNKSRRSCRAVWPSAGFGDQEDDYEKVGMLSPESKTRRFSGHCSAASLKRDCALVRPALRSRQSAPTAKSTQKTFRRSDEQTSELKTLIRISYALLCMNKKNNHI